MEVFEILWEWGQKRKGRCPDTVGDEMGKEVRDWISSVVGEVWVCLQPTCCPKRRGPCTGIRDKATSVWRKVRKEEL